MANNNLFKSNPGNVKDANVENEAGGKAYALSDKAALAQYALTGTFHGTFYASDKMQLDKVLELANKCDVEYVAKLAVYARREGLMKDSPAVLAAIVASKNSELLKKIFPHVVNNPKMLRNFVQIMRSGITGRKSLGTAPKKLIQNYLNGLTDEQLFRADVGNNPSLQDIIKMVHPKAANPARNALYGYLLGKEYDKDALLPLAQQFEIFKKDMETDMPPVPFQMLTALPLTNAHWKVLAQRATWDQIRHNLNTFKRHDVFEDRDIEVAIAAKLQNPDEVRRARVFPYQLFTTYLNVEDVSPRIKLAIQNAAEVAMENVPAIEADMEVCLDVSGSMGSPVTGKRINQKTGREESFTTKMRCIDVASMFAAAFVRKNPFARIIPFDTDVKKVDINPADSVMTNAQKLAASGRRGNTDCGCALAYLNAIGSKSKVVIYVSDNQSWMQSNKTIHGETSMMREWSSYKRRVHDAKLINIDITPYGNVQVYDTNEVLNIGGFSDQAFDVVSKFVKSGGQDTFVKTIEATQFE